jgi:hypothetical protein
LHTTCDQLGGVTSLELVDVDTAVEARQTHVVDLHLYRLLLLNLSLQLFDGVATYQGLRLGFKEANPILLAAFGLIGVGPALLLFKAKACGLLVLLHHAAPRRIGVIVMRALAAVYCVFSLGPWLGKFASLAAGLV